MPTSDELLATFLEVQYPRLVGLLGLYCGSNETAEEIAQEALARVCQQWRRVRKMDEQGAWVYRVAINLANSHFRRRSAERRAVNRLKSAGRNSYHDPDIASVMAIRKAVAALPQRQKTVLLLRYFGDLSFAEVADVLGCPEGTAKSLAHRAIAKLRSEAKLFDLKEPSHAN